MQIDPMQLSMIVENLVGGYIAAKKENKHYVFDKDTEVIGINGNTYTIYENKLIKICVGPDYNYFYNRTNGFFARWGKTINDEAIFSPIGPEILDIEVTTICKGMRIGDKYIPCSFCYKSNTPSGINMKFETFKKILNNMPTNLTQIAFGADSTATSNPDLWKMMEYSRSKGIVPNITVADISDEVAKHLHHYCGAVAVSRYSDKNVCYDSVKKLTDFGMNQINIHIMLSNESYENVMETLKDSMTDPRLKKLNAIVLLSLKKKGRGVKFNCATQKQFTTIVNFALENKIKIGFDSCGCHKFLEAVKDHKNYKEFEQLSEPCESTIASAYIDVNGKFSPCSFCNETKGWEDGIDAVNCNDFNKEVYNNSRVIEFREKLLAGNRHCPIYDI
jgi:hypothetical protein